MYKEMFIMKNISTAHNNIYVNGDSELFNEHFEDYPIVPGAFSLYLCISQAIDYIKNDLDEYYILKNIIKVRYVKPIFPDINIIFLIKSIKQMDNDVIIS